jgi:hypothetical protein
MPMKSWLHTSAAASSNPATMRQSEFDLASSSVQEPAPGVLPRGTALGRFVVLGLVGRGAMGQVYGAYDPELERWLAARTPPP